VWCPQHGACTIGRRVGHENRIECSSQARRLHLEARLQELTLNLAEVVQPPRAKRARQDVIDKVSEQASRQAYVVLLAGQAGRQTERQLRLQEGLQVQALQKVLLLAQNGFGRGRWTCVK
jgi:hypothetical protein